MELFTVRPEVRATLTKDTLQRKPQVVRTFTPVPVGFSRTEHTYTYGPSTKVNPGTGIEISRPASRLPLQNAQDQVGGGTRVVLPQTIPPGNYNFTDVGVNPVSSYNVYLHGLAPYLNIYVDGILAWVTGPSGDTVILTPGQYTITRQNDEVVAYGRGVMGRRYEIYQRATVVDGEEFPLHGHKVLYQFELTRQSQSPGEYLNLERLKNDSWVHVAGEWHQADNDGKAQIGPLPPGTYGVMVADRDGVIYAYYNQAVPGDKLLGAFNFSSGYGYYGWYSGKGFEIRKVFIDVLEEVVASELPSILKIHQILREETLQVQTTPRGTKSPAVQRETFGADDPMSYQRVKTLVLEIFNQVDTAWKHLTPFSLESLVVSDAVQDIYNTYKLAVEQILVKDTSNRPASWLVLDVFNTEDPLTKQNTKTTAYEFLGFEDTGKTTFRQVVREEKLTLDSLGIRTRLGRFALDQFVLEDQKVQTLLALYGEDYVHLTDQLSWQLASYTLRETFYGQDSATHSNVQKRGFEDILVEMRRTSVPKSFIQQEYVQQQEQLILALLNVPTQFPNPPHPNQVYLPGVGFYPPLNSIQPGDPLKRPAFPTGYVKYNNRKVQENLEVQDLIPDNNRNQPDVAAQFEEVAKFERFYRRTQSIQTQDRGVFEREVSAEDLFTVDDTGTLPTKTTFAPSGVQYTPLDVYQQRPEIVLQEDNQGTIHVAYIRASGGVYVARAGEGNVWDGVTAVKVLDTGENEVRWLSLAFDKDNLPLIGVLKTDGYHAYRIQNLLSTPAAAECAFQMGAKTGVLASTHRYNGTRGSTYLFYGWDNNQSGYRVIEGWNIGQMEHKTFPERVRLDHVSHNNGTLLVEHYTPDNPLGRSLFYRVQAPQQATDTLQTGLKARDGILRQIRTPGGFEETVSLSFTAIKGHLQERLRPAEPEEELTTQFKALMGRLGQDPRAETQDTLLTTFTPTQAHYRALRVAGALDDTVTRTFQIQTMAYRLAVQGGSTEDTLSTGLTVTSGYLERI